MAAHATPILSSTSPAALRSLLATERDPHRVQRELVRASLFSCPGKSPRKPR
jgi:hypothetical protein